MISNSCLIPKIKNYSHIPGGSCACVAWSNIFRYMGHNLLESDVFGLGCGYYFGYFAIASKKEFNIALISPEIIKDFFSNVGVYAKPYYLSSEEVDIEKIKESLGMGIPVALQLNPLYIKGLKSTTGEENWQHLPAHWVTVVKYNEQLKKFTFYDNRQFDPIDISHDEFILARNTGSNAQNPKRLSYKIIFPEKILPIEESTRRALEKVAFIYKNQIKHLAVYSGSYGLEKLSRQFSYFQKTLSEEQIIDTANKMMISITGAGGMKGAYRPMFSRFLDKAKNILHKQELDEASECFKTSSKHWIDFTKSLKKISFDPSNQQGFYECTDLLKKILAAEDNGIKKIGTILT